MSPLYTSVFKNFLMAGGYTEAIVFTLISTSNSGDVKARVYQGALATYLRPIFRVSVFQMFRWLGRMHVYDS